MRDKNFLKKIRVLFGADKELCFLCVTKKIVSHGMQKHCGTRHSRFPAYEKLQLSLCDLFMSLRFSCALVRRAFLSVFVFGLCLFSLENISFLKKKFPALTRNFTLRPRGHERFAVRSRSLSPRGQAHREDRGPRPRAFGAGDKCESRHGL